MQSMPPPQPPTPTPKDIAAVSRTSKTHPINVSWLFPHTVLAPSPDGPSPLTSHPDGITPRDLIDLLGVPQSQYPTGRAPSSSGYIGGFPVARTINQPKPVHLTSSPAPQARPPQQANTTTSTARTSSSTYKPKTPSPHPTTSPSLTHLLKPSKSVPTTSTTTTTATFTPSTTPSTSTSTSDPTSIHTAPDRTESTHGREAIETLEALGTDTTTAPDEDLVNSSATPTSTSDPYLTLPNGVTVRGNFGAYGNVALSSCPGKKVRLDTGPVNGRAAINRDLESDFARLSSLNIKCVVCCLNDSELSFLGAPFQVYQAAAAKFGMQILRIPIIEGSCPDRIEDVVDIVERIDGWLRGGVNVLIHCRGGVGRAGLIACCLLLRKRFVENAERAIQVVRLRRSLKAIETMRQEDFIHAYQKYLEETRGNDEEEDGENDLPTFRSGLGSSNDIFEECVEV